MSRKGFKILRIMALTLLAFQLAGCGTLMYPERRGQTGGRIDPQVAILDGLGLILFIIPGVAAYIIDFSNGTIYLPRSKRSSLDLKDMRQVKFDPADFTPAKMERLILEQTGWRIALDQPGTAAYRLGSLEAVASAGRLVPSAEGAVE